MTAELIYRHTRADALAWATEIQIRMTVIHGNRYEWAQAFYENHAPETPENQRGCFIQERSGRFTGLAWPVDTAIPTGWLRYTKSLQMIQPKEHTKAGRAALSELTQFKKPDLARELDEKFKMPERIWHAHGLYSAGIRLESEAVWVSWGKRELAGEKALSRAEADGWERVGLADFILRFGEDAVFNS